MINYMPLLLDGLLKTLMVACISLGFAVVGGVIFGLLRCINHPLMKSVTRIYLEIFRIMPMIVLLYIVFFLLPQIFNTNISGEMTSIVMFTLWGSAEIGELIRGSVEALPISQKETGRSLALTERQIFFYVLLPQCVRSILPGFINFATRLIKTTSLIALIGVMDVVKRGQQIIETTQESFLVYSIIFILFFVICYPLSQLAKYIENKMQRN